MTSELGKLSDNSGKLPRRETGAGHRAPTRCDILVGVRVLEFSTMGPVPWGASLLADMGATVTRICRPADPPAYKAPTAGSTVWRHRRTDIHLDLKTPAGRQNALELVSMHDVLIEGMRPGVMERLNLAPQHCAAFNPRLVYARVTGWGQQGPFALRSGHDINYVALSGALHAIGPKEDKPVPPLNLVGDYGGGGAFLVIGVLAALLHADATGQGSVVDISMLDSVVRQMATIYDRFGRGDWVDERGSNWFDGGAPWYGVYQARCGGYLAVGAIEPQFYQAFVRGLELDASTLPDRADRTQWGVLRERFAAQFSRRTRTEWLAVFDALDACVTPVLSLAEAPVHPHNQARQLFVKTAEGVSTCGLVPRFAPLISS